MPWTPDRARVAALARHRPADDPDLIEARHNLSVSRANARDAAFEAYVRRVVAEAPPLAPAVRDSIVALIRGGTPE